MKIRPKLILTESILSFSLFLSVLFSISTFQNFRVFEDLKIKLASVQDIASRLRFAYIGMTARTDPTSFLLLDYRQLSQDLSFELEEIDEHPLFVRLSPESREAFEKVMVSWAETRANMYLETLEEYLDLRKEAPVDGEVSISILLALVDEEQYPDYVAKLRQADEDIRRLDYRYFSVFEALLGRTMVYLRDVTEEFRINQFRLAVTIPSIVLLISVTIVFIFAFTMSHELRRLDSALSEVAGGDFSVRVDIRGSDEFGSLGTSINAFTRTLGAKLESFRLIMNDIGQTLTTTIDSTQVEETLLKLSIRDTIGDGAALYKVRGESGELMLSQVQGRFRPPFAVSDLPDSPEEEDIMALLRSRIIQPGQTVLGESAVRGEAKLVRNVQFAYDADWVGEQSDPLYLASIIVAPLQVGSTVMGVLAVTSSKPGRFFSDLEFANMQSFAELAGITLDNIYKYADLLEASQLNRELGIAEEIQQDLLPKRLPRLPGTEVAYLSRSIKGMNGDYFDVFPLGEGKTMVTICEVASRGVPAGLLMVMIRTILRLVAYPELNARQIMTLLNRDMTSRIAMENYASIGIFVLAADGSYTFSSAAHNPLQILRKDAEEYESFETTGIPVGIDKDAAYGQVEGRLAPGDLALFHTDGIPESRNRHGEVFGRERLLGVVAGQSQAQPDEIVETLGTELEFFERDTPHKDDQTAIILKYTGEAHA